MVDVVRFALLGLGTGAIYALIAYGLVLVHRGSRVLNFAQGAFALLGAYIFYDLRDTQGWSTPLAMAVAVTALGLMGAFTHLLIMRPLKGSSPIVGMVASLGLLVIIQGVVATVWGADLRLVESPLPSQPVTLPGDIRIGLDRLLLVAVAVVACAILTVSHHRLRYGLAATAVAEDQTVAAVRGVNVDRLGATNWAIGAGLAALAGILIAPTTGLSMAQLSLLVLPALAAALVGNFQSFVMALVAAFAIGITQAELARFVTTPGWPASVPFLLTVIVLILRGKKLPAKNEPPTRIPGLGSGRIPVRLLVVGAGVGIGVVWLIPSTAMVDGITTSAIFGIVALSLVAVTGLAGQVSLAQMALAGVGGLVAAQATVRYGAPFPLALAAGVLAAIPVGLVVAIPAVRARGVSLAVATAGLALMVEGFLLSDATFTGGFMGLNIGSPSLFGINIDALQYPRRYATACLGFLALSALAIANLRRGRGGLSLVALRANERAAAGVGINTLGAKLFAFGVAGGVAGLAGVLTVFRVQTASFESFNVLSGINVLLFAVIGGIGYVSGSLVAALGAPGGVATTLFEPVVSNPDIFLIISGVLLVATLIQAPSGAAALTIGQVRWVRSRVASLARRAHASGEVPRSRSSRNRSLREAMHSGPRKRRAAPDETELSVSGLRVEFGGVTALQDLSLEVRNGTITGLIGSNGAGKSTLVEVICGYVEPTRGQVTIDGSSLVGLAPHQRARRGVVRVAQYLELFNDLTVADNIRVALAPADWRSSAVDLLWPRTTQLDDFTLSLVDELGLTDELDRFPPELSYGHRRLLGVVRALATRPRVLLLDEPGAGLDDQERKVLAAFIKRIATELDLAVLLIEHDVPMVLDIADQVTVLDAGQVLADGTPTDVRANKDVVSAFLGSPTADHSPRAPERATALSVTGGPLVVSASDLAAGYNAQPVVRGVNLEVRAGEIVAMLGRNGSGKTTVLQTLAGALPKISGDILWGDRPPGPLHTARRHGVGLLTDTRTVTMGLTARENLRLARVDVDRAVSMFPALAGLLGRRASLLSGGEQQMLAVACAQTEGLRLLLADEMSLGLAPAVTESLFESLRTIADTGVGILLVEQHVGTALSIADHVCVLSAGTIQLSGPAAEIATQLDEVTAHYLAPQCQPV